MDPMTQSEPSAVDRLRERLRDLTTNELNLLQGAEASKRDLSEEEKTKIVSIQGERTSLEAEIDLRIKAAEAQARILAPQPSPISSPVAEAKAMTKTPQHEPLRQPSPITGEDMITRDPKCGFKHGGDFLAAIRNVHQGAFDYRLRAMAAQTMYANEGVGTEGAWAMPPEFASGIIEAVAGQATLLGRMKPMQSASNFFYAPVDESTAWGSTGLQPKKNAETVAATASKLAINQRVVQLFKATVFTNVTEELNADNPAVTQYITRIMGRQLQGLVERWILNGSGVGEPLGILNAPALVSVAAETSGNTSGTLIRQNLSKMSGRLIPGYENEAFWVVSPSAKIAVNDVKLAASGNRRDDYSAGFTDPLLGYPMVTSMESPAVGTVGDIMLVAPSGFMTMTRGGVNTQATIFFAFDQGLTTLRAYIRIGQQPILSAAVTPKLDTATTLSHCVATATRTG